MRICPRCRHINDDEQKTCEMCHYDLTYIPTEPAKKRERRKRNQTILIVVIAIVGIVALLLFSAFSSYRSNYTLPEWMVERMTHGRKSVAISTPVAELPAALQQKTIQHS